MVEALAAGLGIWNVNLSNDLTGIENILPPVIHRRENEKFLQWNGFLRRSSNDLNLRVKRYQCRGSIRGVYDIARAAAQDCMKTPIARNRVAERASFAQAIEVRRSEVPAERPLADVTGQRTRIANLRRSRFARCIRKDQQFFPHRGMLFEIGEPRQGADAKPAAFFSDVI